MTARLVAFDVDGTLVGPELSISPGVQRAVGAMRAAGILGCLVTGRMYRSALPFARELRFETPLICYQGAAIIDPATDEILHHVALSNEIVRELISVTEADRVHLQLYRNDEYYCETRNRFSDYYARLSMAEPVVVPSLREAFSYTPATKGIVVADAADAARYTERLGRYFDGRAYITRSLPEFVEILNCAVDKGAALEFVANRLGVAMKDTVAIGDSWNDAPLLRAAGFAIAMGSAPPELCALADASVADLAHDGVVEALESFVLPK